MSAVVLLALAFVSIAVVGTALAAANDLIANAIARSRVRARVGFDRACVGSVAARPAANGGERPTPPAARPPAIVRVRLRSVDRAAPHVRA